VAGAMIAVAAASPGPITVTLDGRQKQVRAGSLLADLGNGAFKSMPGDLIAINGSVLETAAGEPPVFIRDGRSIQRDTRLFDGDVIRSRPGSDVMERAVSETVTVPYGTVVVGEGPISGVATAGVTGIRRVTRGETSHISVVDMTIREKVDQVVVRSRPTSDTKTIALTFDDGPWPGQTNAILDVLKANGVPATFFLVGGRATLYPDLVRREAAEGQLIGSHTLGHRGLAGLTPAQVHVQIGHGGDRIARITGVQPVWFRPPYGAMTGIAWREVRDRGLRVVNWDVDSLDWRQPGAKQIAANVLAAARPGSIVLMHDGGGDRSQTVAALPEIITGLKAQGYVFVTVQDMSKLP
jgi:peptidoglycan/xylan/chitin deacetylase (PgdA/CDA1 family)